MTENLSLFAEEPLFVVGRPVVSIFHNKENLFSIIKLKIQETNTDYSEKEIIVAGYFPQVDTEAMYRFQGDLKQHPKYGLQFQATSFEKEIPATETGVIQYLSSDLFPGIGKRTAEIIVEKLGPNAIKKIIENPDALEHIPRLSDDKKETLRDVLKANLGMDRILIKLGEWGFGPQVAVRIYQKYEDKTIQLLQENPYRLIEDISGIGFNRADDLGEQLEITGDNPGRIKAAVLHLLNQMALSDGHVYMEATQLITEAKELLEKSQPIIIDIEAVSAAIIELGKNGKLCGEAQRLYMPSLYYSEVGIAETLLELISRNDEQSAFPSSEIRKWIGDAEERFNVVYAEPQVKAIETAINSAAMILTGGPGTGKTTVVRGLVDVYAELHGLSLDMKEYDKDTPFPIVLAAPTGRAAKRLSESTGLPAQTIHRLLGFTGQEDPDEETERNIAGKLIIIDEMSMVDTWLAYQLLKALPEDCQIIFVGDQDQLPPVGPGQVLKDMLDSHVIPTVELGQVYRQANGSSIVEMAHQLKHNMIPTNLTEKTGDRSFIQAHASQIPTVVSQIIQSALKKGFTIYDVQVLAPMYRGDAGIDNLNHMIQELVNPKKNAKTKEMAFGDTTYRIGDKVLQLINQPQSNVFNGDMGEVIAIFRAKETTDNVDQLIVSFDGNEVTYSRGDLSQLTLAYCCSIHKSQGSEFPMVIMPVVRSYYKMLRKNLLYTGLTRAKDFLILCGEPETFVRGVQNIADVSRRTTLVGRLNGALEAEEISTNDTDYSTDNSEKRLTLENISTIDPMIGMESVTPQQFL
ncbi:ATP-dependent RecD-like DNA helicase [Kurthia huakuii]|uniref:SF1B family DNA helicase RecD2 n=1 Tax=Kurthia huakuii TaxID=1421019 RepID=UPI000496150A|nr:ATP-dependent RecD-like DNA helicase [Kurthia huakuii]MBM7697920.1 exodeoxyribonuclease V alpha subunit [Kurthia huakuii]